jgi:hypothetical protein
MYTSEMPIRFIRFLYDEAFLNTEMYRFELHVSLGQQSFLILLYFEFPFYPLFFFPPFSLAKMKFTSLA